MQEREAREVVRISKYACDTSRPMGIFRPEIGQRNSKNPVSPAGPRFLCLAPAPFPILCSAKSQFSKIRSATPIQGPASQAIYCMAAEI